MTRPPFSVVLSALALITAPALASAQAVVQPLGPTDADRLAAAMRRLAVSPNDMAALIEAGEWSLRLGDLSGAASLFARADKIDPRNGRVKAGMGSILVRAERPGEALRYFQMAESFGLAPPSFAADRGLAYDLVGEPERAQRDYRLALKAKPDDETVRRYALSLGISGKRDPALQQLDPLLRRTDRGAWRARAFVLAMTGDAAGASRIATTMMPGGMATGLQPFFQRLASLPPADRAFAVHFGEVRATPERLADARLTPAFSALGPDPDAPRTVVAAVQPGLSADRSRRNRGGRDDGRRAPVEVAQRTPVAAAVYRAQSGAPPVAPQVMTPSLAAASLPAAAERATAPAVSSPPVVAAAIAPAVTTRLSAAPVVLASTGVARVAPAPVVQAQPASTQSASTTSAAPLGIGHPLAITAPLSVPAPTVGVPRPAAPLPASIADVSAPVTPSQIAAASVSATPSAVAATVPPSSASASAPPALTLAGAINPAPAPVSDVATAAAAPPEPAVSPAPEMAALAGASAPMMPSTAPPTAITSVALPPSTVSIPSEPAAPTAAARVSEDTILAKIVANLSIPAAELGVAAPPRAAAAEPAAAEPAAAATRDVPEKPALVNKQVGVHDEAGSRGHDKAVAARSNAADDGDPEVGRLAPSKKPGGKAASAASHGGSKRLASENDADDAKASTGTKGEKVAGKGGSKAALVEAGTGADKKATDRKLTDSRGTDRKATAKSLADKPAIDGKKPVGGNPERIWVQVAGGASDDDLPKAWASAKAKAPEAFAGRAGYTTPLRATNRVLAGPFKTDAEARRFVNQLSKKGVSAFAFTSDAGQVVAKLPSE